MTRLALAWLHLIALGIGMGAVWVRGRALSGPLDAAAVRRAFAADSLWGLAAGLWITTGLWRLFAGTEKATGYYFADHAFWFKMALLGAILALEVWPMVTLIRWRVAAKRGAAGDERTARRIATISYVQGALVVLMVGVAAAMARGYGQRG